MQSPEYNGSPSGEQLALATKSIIQQFPALAAQASEVQTAIETFAGVEWKSPRAEGVREVAGRKPRRILAERPGAASYTCTHSMRVRGWFWKARYVFVLLLGLTIVPAAALFWLSWRSLAQDQLLEAQRVRDGRERAADLIAAALEQKLAAEEQRLGAWSPEPGDDAIVVEFGSGQIRTHPANALLYYPTVTPIEDLPAQVFQTGEDLEFQWQDYPQAISIFRVLARSADSRIRAGASLRLARNLRKSGQTQAALDSYAELATRGPVPLDGALNGTPADLVARRARYWLLSELNRPADARREAEALARDLDSGHWRLDRATFLHYCGEIGHQPPTGGMALAAAVDWLWSKRNEAPSGRWTFASDGRNFTVLWRDGRALIAGPRYVEHVWIAALDPLLKSQGARLEVEPATRPGQDRAFRAASATGLPWSFHLSTADSVSPSRQRFFLTAAGLLFILLCAGSYWTASAVKRELAVARLQSDFVAAVSHEFRTPLTLLRQTTEAFVENRAGDEVQRRTYFEAQARATDRLHRLVESLLDFGRMEAGAKPYRLQPLDAAQFARGVVDEFQHEAPGRIGLSLPDDAAPIEADPHALAHALWNLLDNAFKYSPQGPDVRVTLERRGGEIAITVRDRGIGIPRAEQKAIFGKFVRGEAAQSNGYKGAGIGLSMVAHIVEAHHGRVTLESAPGAGSTFTILLPAKN